MKTDSGIENAKWLQRLVDLYERKGIIKGPLSRTLKNEKLVKSRITDHDPRFHDFLRRVQLISLGQKKFSGAGEEHADSKGSH